MPTRMLPLALALLALAADSSGAHGVASYVLLAGVPAAAAAALAWFGDHVHCPARSREALVGRVQTAFAALSLVLLLVAAAVRAPARLDAAVPAGGTSALLACLALYGLQALVGLGFGLPRGAAASPPRRRTRVA